MLWDMCKLFSNMLCDMSWILSNFVWEHFQEENWEMLSGTFLRHIPRCFQNLYKLLSRTFLAWPQPFRQVIADSVLILYLNSEAARLGDRRTDLVRTAGVRTGKGRTLHQVRHERTDMCSCYGKPMKRLEKTKDESNGNLMET